MFGIYVLERLFDTTSTAVLAGLALLFFPEMLSLGGADRAWEARARHGPRAVRGTTGGPRVSGVLPPARRRCSGAAPGGLAHRHGLEARRCRGIRRLQRGLAGDSNFTGPARGHWLFGLALDRCRADFLLGAAQLRGAPGEARFRRRDAAASDHHGGLDLAIAGRGRRVASRQLSCTHCRIWSRKGARCCRVDRAVAHGLRRIALSGCALTDPRRVVDRSEE